jgi:hypothetical protein
MANDNCLAGMRCPKCKSYGPFGIGITAWATVSDDGFDSVENGDWDQDSPCLCVNCQYQDLVAKFTTVNQKKEKKSKKA